jgi:hypothetical protein
MLLLKTAIFFARDILVSAFDFGVGLMKIRFMALGISRNVTFFSASEASRAVESFLDF